MKLALTIVYIVIALILTVVVLFQKGKDYGANAITGGSSSDTFFSKNKSNTKEALLEKLTAFFAVMFIVLSVVLSLSIVK